MDPVAQPRYPMDKSDCSPAIASEVRIPLRCKAECKGKCKCKCKCKFSAVSGPDWIWPKWDEFGLRCTPVPLIRPKASSQPTGCHHARSESQNSGPCTVMTLSTQSSPPALLQDAKMAGACSGLLTKAGRSKPGNGACDGPVDMGGAILTMGCEIGVPRLKARRGGAL